MIINHNLSAINSNKVLKFKHWDVNRSMEQLSSGMRINRAGDDASGLAVSEKMRTQIQGLRQAERNTEDGMSFVQTAEGYLNQTATYCKESGFLRFSHLMVSILLKTDSLFRLKYRSG
jgi:flagellin